MIPDWMPEPGNYFVMSGTWLIDRQTDKQGVVREIGDQHESGTVVILWRYDSTQYISVPLFISELVSGRFEIDPDQHPYNKADQYWEASA